MTERLSRTLSVCRIQLLRTHERITKHMHALQIGWTWDPRVERSKVHQLFDYLRGNFGNGIPWKYNDVPSHHHRRELIGVRPRHNQL